MASLISNKLNPPKDTKPSFQGRNVIVTGANVGLGFECAIKFVQLGADRVILGVRTLSKGEEAKQQIETRTGRKGCVAVWHLDLLDYESMRAFAKRVENDLSHLDIVVLNAGIISYKYSQTMYGWEKTLQTNVFSTVLLGLLLMPKLKASKTADFTPVLELVSSATHAPPHTTSLRSETAPLAAYNTSKGYNFKDQYGHSKLFLEYGHTGLTHLAQNQQTGKPDVYVVSVCPGITQSEFTRDFKSLWYMQPVIMLVSLVMRAAEEGSRTYISGIALGEKGHGRFWTWDEIKE
ncbi:hypothetical protein LTR65_002073 [Meristemomyces frigidus]